MLPWSHPVLVWPKPEYMLDGMTGRHGNIIKYSTWVCDVLLSSWNWLNLNWASTIQADDAHPHTYCGTLTILRDRCSDHVFHALLDQVFHGLVGAPQHFEGLERSQTWLAQRCSFHPLRDDLLKVADRGAARSFRQVQLWPFMLGQLRPLGRCTSKASAKGTLRQLWRPSKPSKVSAQVFPSLFWLHGERLIGYVMSLTVNALIAKLPTYAIETVWRQWTNAH